MSDRSSRAAAGCSTGVLPVRTTWGINWSPEQIASWLGVGSSVTNVRSGPYSQVRQATGSSVTLRRSARSCSCGPLSHGNVPLEHLLSGTLDATIEGLPDGVPGAIAVKT